MKFQHLLSTAVALGLSLSGGTAAAADEQSVARLTWLSGCWSVEGAEPGSGEQWSPPAGGSLLGVSRTVRQGKTVAWEFMRIAEAADGRLAFFAQPSGQPPASFPVLSLSDSEVVFENLEHDFPQRVIYRFQPPASLRASIEGLRDGSLESVAFPMRRVSCDSQLAAPGREVTQNR